MSKLHLLIGISGRSAAPLSDPIIKALQNETEWCHFQTIQLETANFLKSYKICQDLFDKSQYDLVLVIGDRIEAMAFGICAFLNNQKIIHLGSGILNKSIATYDDIMRHNICLLSDIQLVEDINCFKVTHDLLDIIKKTNHHIHIIGNLYAEGLDDIDTSYVPDEPYDLILINYETLSSDKENYENYKQAVDSVKEKQAIYIGGNPDGKFGGVYINNDYNLKYYDNLPRSQFLGLLSKCSRFISNSSSIYTEAPYYLKPEQIIQIGDRNKDRTTPVNFEKGATEKVIKILKKWWDGKYVE